MTSPKSLDELLPARVIKSNGSTIPFATTLDFRGDAVRVARTPNADGSNTMVHTVRAIASTADLLAEAGSSSDELVPSETEYSSLATLELVGDNVIIRGSHRKASALKALAAAMTLLDLSGAPGKMLTVENVTLDANNKAFGLITGGSLFDSIEIHRCDFVGMGAEGSAISVGNLHHLEVSDCLFDGLGKMVATAIAITGPVQTLVAKYNRFRGLNTGISIAPGVQLPSVRNITIEGNVFDMMYYSAPALASLSNSGGTVTYTSSTLVDTSKTFSLGVYGTIGTFNQFSYIRALTPRHSATTSSVSRSQLVDNSATFTSYGIIPGEIVRCGTAQALVISVEDDTHLNLEEWLDSTTMLPAATPSGSYTVYGVLLGRATSVGTPNTITLDRPWADLNGATATPSAGTLYECVCTPNYPVTTSSSAHRVRIVGNTVLRSYTDGLSPFGDECEIASNVIVDGQDVGITIDGSVSLAGVKGGRHNVHDNLIVRAGSEGIYYGGEFAPCIHHNRIFGWGARGAGLNSPGAGASGIDLNPAGVSAITGGIVDHNIIDGDGLPNAYYGITALDLVDIDLDTNNISNVVRNDYNIEGDNTANVTLRHRNSSIDYTTSGGRGTAPGVLSTLYGAGPPLGTVVAGIGSTYFDTLNGLMWFKASGTGATGWKYLSATEFTPLSIPNGLQFFVRADLGTTLSGSDVTTWADQSGAGDTNRNLVGAVGHRPTLQASDADFNNLPCLKFDPSGAYQVLISGTWSTPLPAVSTWFMVAKARVSGIMVAQDGISNTHRQSILANSSSFVEGSSGGDCVSAIHMYEATRSIIMVFNGASSKIYVSEAAGESGGDPGSETLTGLTVGALNDGSSFAFDGKISDIAAWNRVLTADEIASLNTYASTRYGVSIS